jgi:hypothetical protein
LVAGAGFGPAGCLLSGVAITFANDVPEAQNCILASLSYDCFPDGLARAGTAYLVKVFGCRQASENRPCTNPRGCGDGLWGFRVLRGSGGCAAGSVRPLAAARCVRFVARRMTDWEPAAAERQQLSADPNARRTLGHSLQRWQRAVREVPAYAR